MLPVFPQGPLTAQDILDRPTFLERRPALLALVLQEKKQRRVSLGDHMTLLFESKLLIWWQIQEILRIEHEAPVQEEIEAYQDLVPTPHRLCATLFLEYPDPTERQNALRTLQGIDTTLCLSFDDVTLKGISQHAPKDTASAVNFISFPLSDTEKMAFHKAENVMLKVTHPHATLSCPLSPLLKVSLEGDLRVSL